jgi:hypothetical protein
VASSAFRKDVNMHRNTRKREAAMGIPPNEKGKPPIAKIDIAGLKRLFTLARKRQVGCAVGLTVDGKARIMLHKVKKPKAILRDLTEQFGDLKSLRWGTVEVDENEKPKQILLTLNRSIPGLDIRLKKIIKGTGFTQVEVRSDQD